MAELAVLKFEWRGLTGGNGLSQFAVEVGTVEEMNAAAAAIRSFFGGLVTRMPDNISIHCLPEFSIHEHTTGTLVGAANLSTVPAPVVGTNAGPYAEPCGASVQWTTATIMNGHWIKGRTYLVPMSSTAFNDATGGIHATVVAEIENAADAIVDHNSIGTTKNIVVWGRPKKATATSPSRPASLGIITGRRVPSKAAILSTRRD